ncbi:sensor histidine kinase [Desulfotalea psychrophila]|uniref:histidine kinase n=1 Tax=Desulfotalea psychrophila (strain LSv54 / DSM 12343) TaxID=177439 RepID=Q6AJC9_DESPS|nr:ATP-binding protein [Desulfotalea psychrophila]CAG37551.1 related to two-component system sensor histidine kinase (Ntr family) [Desulfotalea psychrophila LSv54]
MHNLVDKNSSKFTEEEQRRHKQKLIRRVIVLCLCLIPLFIWVQSYLVTSRGESSFNNNILIFALININVLLVLFVLFLVLRNLAELLFERRISKLGRTLKTKLIASFLSLSLIPTILLFFVALQFVSTSMDYWFNTNIENSLEESLKLAQSLYQDKKEQAGDIGRAIAKTLEEKEGQKQSSEDIQHIFNSATSYNGIEGPDSISLIGHEQKTEVQSLSADLAGISLPNIPIATLQKVREQHVQEISIQEIKEGDLIRSVRIIEWGQETKAPMILVTTILIKQVQLERMETISDGIERYRQLKYFKEPFKFWLLIILLIVTLLVIFAAIWFGIYIARGITTPLEKIVDATKRVADGDLQFTMSNDSNDEMGMLIDSFNQMTSDLYESNDQLEKTYQALMISSQESEQRRRYTEIILQNVSAGVISLDDQGRITTVNHFAEKLLNINKDHFIGLTFSQVLPANQTDIVNGFINELRETGKTSLQQHIKLQVMGKSYSLLINFTHLEDENHRSLGFVLVFDNLTKLEKMQRMAAWREVARRIAHEIKNPLTPIQLSAQRLRRRYPEILKEENSIFDQCTSTIISQVDELKTLVSEFSQFARMPKIQKNPADIYRLTKRTLILYQEAHKHIEFSCHADVDIPIFSFDAEQIGRCLINLLDNAVAVLPDKGTIHIELTLAQETETVLIKVADDGPGISKENRGKLFEPYFSTKKTGTGLGLAIVSTIVADHNGYIRVQENTPKGSLFIIELPLTSEKEITK